MEDDKPTRPAIPRIREVPRYRPLKVTVTIRIDVDIMEWLQSGGPGYQTRVNDYLRQAMEQLRQPRLACGHVSLEQCDVTCAQSTPLRPQPVRFPGVPHSRTLNPAPVSTHQMSEGCYHTEPTKTDE